VPVGIVDQTPYEEGTARLEAGDAILLYTDGVTEARNAEGELFGEDRLRETFQEAAGCGVPDEVIERIRATLEEFTVGQPPADDTTMLCLTAAHSES
jgi:sigma-B regulation protein RsbU (phosphoserine phosphatase)